MILTLCLCDLFREAKMKESLVAKISNNEWASTNTAVLLLCC